MVSSIRLIQATLLFLFVSPELKAQGCSDAGFCTIQSIKNNTVIYDEKTTHRNDLMIGFGYGIGERDISYYTPYVQYTRTITARTSVTVKINYAAISGELTNTNGLSDLLLSLNHVFGKKTNKWQRSLIAGVKIPLEDGGKEKNGIRLPMPYQPSLGTTDLVLGLNFIRSSFGATLALQQPLKATNNNSFLPDNYPLNQVTVNYDPTNKFVRKGDMLLRVSYQFITGKKFSIRPSLLSIYHLANDSYLDANKLRRVIVNSSGLTMNSNIFFDLKLKNSTALELSLGAPFIIRDQRPDGLTRHFVAALEYKFSF